MNAAGEQVRHPRVGERVTLIECGTPMIVDSVDFDPDTGDLYVRAIAAGGCRYCRTEHFRRGWPAGEGS